jgi:hypothetical protein
LLAQNRTAIALNANASDVKLRDNRITQFRHFAVLAGTSSIVIGNHWFQGDSETEGLRTAGLVLTSPHNRATVTGNYIDNCSIEWTNEHDSAPEQDSEFSFSALNISDNIFQAIDAAPWSRFIVVKPYGAGHFINGLNVTGNVFRSIHTVLDRVEGVDTSFADLDYGRMRNILIQGNTFNIIERGIENPRIMDVTQNTLSDAWTVDCSNALAFDGRARNVTSLVAEGRIKNAANVSNWDFPYIQAEQGANDDQIIINFSEEVTGSMVMTVRMDNF